MHLTLIRNLFAVSAVREKDARNDVVLDIFWHPLLLQVWHNAQPCCRSRVFQHLPFCLKTALLLQVAVVILCVVSEGLCVDEWKHNDVITCDHLRPQDVDWIYCCFGDTAGELLLYAFTGWSWQDDFSSEKSQSIFGWKRCLGWFKWFIALSFLLSLMA